MSTNLFSTLDKQHGWLNLLIVFSVCSVLLIDRYHFHRKMASKRKSLTPEQRAQVVKALDSGCSCRDVALSLGVENANCQDQDFTAKFTYVQVYVHTFTVLSNLLKFVISAWNKHIHVNRLYQSIVNVWWCSGVMCTSTTGPLIGGDASLSGVPLSQVSLYNSGSSQCVELPDFFLLHVFMCV